MFPHKTQVHISIIVFFFFFSHWVTWKCFSRIHPSLPVQLSSLSRGRRCQLLVLLRWATFSFTRPVSDLARVSTRVYARVNELTSVKAVLACRLQVHVSFLHFFGFFLFFPRKSLAFGAHNLIISITNQLLAFLNENKEIFMCAFARTMLAKHSRNPSIFELFMYNPWARILSKMRPFKSKQLNSTYNSKTAVSFPQCARRWNIWNIVQVYCGPGKTKQTRSLWYL